jgi:hypothetical protein
VAKGEIKGMGMLFGDGTRGEIDDPPKELKFWVVKALLFLLWASIGAVVAQTGTGESSIGLSDLPSAEAKAKLPGLDEPAPTPDFSGVTPPESPSIPQLRPPVADPAKSKATDSSDWAAQAMLQKKEEAKKREEEQTALAEQKARETQMTLDKEKKEKEAKAKSSDQPAVAKAAVPGFGQAEAQKLPAVTGLDGVKPRGMASDDGRVQPGFDSFTGPSSGSPLGKDFQSGAKPIMPGTTTTDGRMQVSSKIPEPPSGAYKRISQDPYTLPAGYGEKKAAPPSQPKPVVIPPNPTSGDPKRAIDDTKAGYSPYDNSKKVPDPRSQRRF